MRARVLVFSAVLLLGVAGCGGAVPQPRPGQLLYVTTFDAYNEDWQQFEGRLSAKVVGGGANPVIQITIDDVQEGAFTLLDQVFGDFDLIVEATQVAGPDNNGFGVIFRHQDNRNFYLFMISGDGYYQVVRRLDGVDEVLSDWAPTLLIRQGQATNAIRVIARGSRFAFLINDEQVPLCPTLWNPVVPGDCLEAQTTMHLVDSSFAQGRIGLGARSFDQSGVVVAFDNMIICGPQETPPVPYRCEEALADAP